jgi:hypothetical protein
LKNSTGVAVVDDQHHPWLSRYEWRELRRLKARTTYAVASIPTTDGALASVSMHRLLLNLGQGDPRQVDHRDHNGLNNQLDNLRIATRKQNLANVALRYDSTSGYKGVSYHAPSRRWRTRTGVNGHVYLGMYSNRHSAALAYNLAALALYGEFASLNDIPQDQLPLPDEERLIRHHVLLAVSHHQTQCPICSTSPLQISVPLPLFTDNHPGLVLPAGNLLVPHAQPLPESPALLPLETAPLAV